MKETQAMTDYTTMEPGEMYHALGADAMKWAEAFCQYHPEAQVEVDQMLGWFANAMMAMHDHLTGHAPVVLPDGSAFFVGAVQEPQHD